MKSDLQLFWAYHFDKSSLLVLNKYQCLSLWILDIIFPIPKQDWQVRNILKWLTETKVKLKHQLFWSKLLNRVFLNFKDYLLWLVWLLIIVHLPWNHIAENAPICSDCKQANFPLGKPLKFYTKRIFIFVFWEQVLRFR